MGLDDYEEEVAEEPTNFTWVHGVGIVVGVVGAFFGVPSSSKSQTITEELIEEQTSPNYLPNMTDFTRSGGTKVNTGTGTSQGCKSGNFCTRLVNKG